MELEWQQEHLKEGRYTLHMGHIDKKIQELVKEIIAREFEEATRTKKNKRRQGPSFDSHLSAIKNHTNSQGYLALYANLRYRLSTIQLLIRSRRV